MIGCKAQEEECKECVRRGLSSWRRQARAQACRKAAKLGPASTQFVGVLSSKLEDGIEDESVTACARGALAELHSAGVHVGRRGLMVATQNASEDLATHNTGFVQTRAAKDFAALSPRGVECLSKSVVDDVFSDSALAQAPLSSFRLRM